MEPYVSRRSTHTLILLLLLVAAIGLTLFVVKQRQELRKIAEAVTRLELVPSDTQVNQGEEFTLDVVISTGANTQVTRADVTVLYDANYLDGLSFTNGSFLPQEEAAGLIGNGVANIVLKANDADPQQGQNQILATLRFKARNPVDNSTVTFDEGVIRIDSVGQTGVPISTSGSAVTVVRTVAAETNLRFEPSAASVRVGQDVSVNILINTGANQVTVADVVVNFDQSLLEGVSFTNSNLLPRVLRNGSFSGGTARITLGSLETQAFTGEGTLAVLTFRARAVGQSSLAFASQTKVTAQGTDENMLREGQGGTVTVSSATTPQPTPSPQPTPTPAGDTGGTAIATPPSAPGCTKVTPLSPTNLRASIPGPRQVTLSWNESVYATHYGIVYGRSPGRYEYGAANVGYTTSYTVGNLSSGTTYYFAVFAVNDCAPSGYSNEVAARTQGAAVATPGAAGVTDQPTPPPEEPAPGFVALPDDKGEVIPFLAGRGRVATPVPELPQVVIPPEEATPAPKVSPLLTPLGGLLLIIIALFLGIFFWRMKSS